MKKTQDIRPLLKRLKQQLNHVYGARLEALILYGSFARDRATDDSDIDIAVLLKGAVNSSEEIDRLSEIVSELGLEYDELVSVLPLSAEEVKDSVWPLCKNLKREGVVL